MTQPFLVERWLPAVEGSGAQAPQDSLLTQLRTDTGNAERFFLVNKDDARYCHPFRDWFTFNRNVWRRDGDGRIRLLAKWAMIRCLEEAAAARDSEVEKFARASLNSKRITDMLQEARALLAISPDDFDAQPDLLVFRNGTVDLRTGEIGPHDRTHFITKMVQFDYVPGAACELFLATLNKLMGDDGSTPGRARAERLVNALQVFFGYTLTARTSEKVIFILLGGGNNGKTTILTLFLRLLKEYSTLLQIETLMTRQENNNSQADLADLRGVRFAMTSETEEGQRIAEAKLKKITQGMGDIRGVRKYENPTSFPETHKLWMDANHQPEIRGTDAAIWNRILMIPFSVTIAPSEIDRDLPAKLLTEAEGILAWAVAGAVRWYRDGLPRPGEVRDAVSAYRAEMDQVGRFEGCILDEGMSVFTTELYGFYREWCDARGERRIDQKTFTAKLAEPEHGLTLTARKVVGIGRSPRSDD